MREIKFRAWDEGNKEMHYDFQFIKSGNDGNDWMIFTSDKNKLGDEQHPFNNPYFQQQFHITQFTGLKDKNGKEIYEGDIMQTATGPAVVRFDNNEVEFVCDNKSCYIHPASWNKREVLGNIFENPELTEAASCGQGSAPENTSESANKSANKQSVTQG